MVTQTQLSGLDALVADPELLAEAKLEPHNLWIHFEEHFPEPRAGMNLAQLLPLVRAAPGHDQGRLLVHVAKAGAGA